MRTAIRITTLAMLLSTVGLAGEQPQTAEPCLYLTADFQVGQTLRYRFVTDRTVDINWDPSGTMSRGRQADNKVTESLEIIMAYEPVEVDPYGLSTIKATCESVKAARSRSTSGRAGLRDAAETLAGKSFMFTVDPAGRLVDTSAVDALIKEAGDAAFRPATDTSRGRIKEPDMIGDFTATQWFLYDAIASVPSPSKGVVVGQNWSSQLSIPTPMVYRQGRDVRYTLGEVRPNPQGRLAVIKEAFSLAESPRRDWPMPYVGSFQVAGTFGFLRGYKFLSLEGTGEQVYNIDAGRPESYKHAYVLKAEAMMMIPLGPNPQLTMDQTITMSRVTD